MATPMLISTSVPDVLRRAADQIAALPQPMVGRIEIHHALLAAGPTVQQAQDALDAIHTHLPPGDPGIDRWTHRRHRDQAAALLRQVADAAATVPARAAVAGVLRAAERHVRGPVNASLRDALLTVTRDRDLARAAVEALANWIGRHPRDLPLWDATRSRARVARALRAAAADLDPRGQRPRLTASAAFDLIAEGAA